MTEMFQLIGVKNFKGITNAEISLSRVNVFVGENGTGKSTIGQALEMLKTSKGTQGINTNLPEMNLGTIDKLVPTGDKAEIKIEGTIDLNLKEPLNHPLSYSLSISFDSSGLDSYSLSVKLGEYSLSSNYSRGGPVILNPTQFKVEDINFNLQPIISIGTLFQGGGFGYPQDKMKLANEINLSLTKISVAVGESLQQISIVPVFRGFLEPTYPLQPGFSQGMNIRGNMVQVSSAEASNLMYLDPSSKVKLRAWSRYILDAEFDTKIVPGAQVAVINPEKDIFITNEGFGLNQLIPILSTIVRASKDSLVIIEEPEIHLHPRAQFKLGLLVPKIAKEEGIQVVLVTHSEHVVSGILSAVRNTDVVPENVAMWLFEKNEGRNMVSKCAVNKDGSTEGGLKTFIQASIDEIREKTNVSEKGDSRESGNR
jgi:energy-coupling factor transporter ATP-binding protein EcfA2